IALGLDRIVTEPLAQLLAQLADMALDHRLVDLGVEQAVDLVEDLGLGDPAAAAANEELEDAALAARQRHHLATDLGITAVEIDLDVAERDLGVIGATLLGAALHGVDPGEDLADVDRLADDVVDAGGEQFECLLEISRFVHRNDRGLRTAADHRGEAGAVL